jgi:hypothetical protein
MKELNFTKEHIVLLQNRYQANVLEVSFKDSPTMWVKFDDGREVYLNSETLEER